MRPARLRLLGHLRNLARIGQPCPPNAELGAAIGIGTVHASKVLAELRDLNRISVERVGNRRIVTLIGEGLKTADPRPRPSTSILKPRVREITNAAAEIFDVPFDDIRSPSRRRKNVVARQAVCLVAMERGWSSCAIARALDRDHSTILHARNRAKARRCDDAGYAAQVAALMQRSPLRLVQA